MARQPCPDPISTSFFSSWRRSGYPPDTISAAAMQNAAWRTQIRLSRTASVAANRRFRGTTPAHGDLLSTEGNAGSGYVEKGGGRSVASRADGFGKSGIARPYQRRGARHPPPARRKGLFLSRHQGQDRFRRKNARPHQISRHPAGLDRRVDFSCGERPYPGDRPRRPGPQAIPLSRTLVALPRRGEVLQPRRICRRAAGTARPGRYRPAPSQSAARKKSSPRSSGCSTTR